MLLAGFYVLLFLCKSTGALEQTTQPWTTAWTVTSTSSKGTTTTTATTTTTTEEPLSPLQLSATPDYPVAAGQKVNLNCSALTMPDNVVWSWQHWENQTWKEVKRGSDRELTLTEPQQSGAYQCQAESKSQISKSLSHTVYIISMHATVGENLGIAAFVLSLLALIINFVILFWLGWQRLGDPQTTSNPVAKGFPGPEKSQKGGFPQADGDGDVYMNYTSTNQAYTDLDITNMSMDNVYSSLS